MSIDVLHSVCYLHSLVASALNFLSHGDAAPFFEESYWLGDAGRDNVRGLFLFNRACSTIAGTECSQHNAVTWCVYSMIIRSHPNTTVNCFEQLQQ